MVLKPNFVQNNNSEQVKIVNMKFAALKYRTNELVLLKKCLSAVEKYHYYNKEADEKSVQENVKDINQKITKQNNYKKEREEEQEHSL